MLIVVGFPWSYIKQASESRAQKTARRCGVKTQGRKQGVQSVNSVYASNTAKQEGARIEKKLNSAGLTIRAGEMKARKSPLERGNKGVSIKMHLVSRRNQPIRCRQAEE